MRKSLLTALITAALTAGTGLQAAAATETAPIPPDEWHCRTVTAAGDELCLHLNQFLGWWTGFTAEFRHASAGVTWMNVQMRWTTSRGESGWLPEAHSVYLLDPGEIASGGSWADLPSFACVTVDAYMWWPGGSSRWSDPVTVCRDN